MPSTDPSQTNSNTFKRNLRWLIQRRGITQRQLAADAGVPEKWLRRLCNQGLSRLPYGDRATETTDRLERLLWGLATDLHEDQSVHLLWHEGLPAKLTANAEVSDRWLAATIDLLRASFAESQHSRYLQSVLRAIDIAYAAATSSTARRDSETQPRPASSPSQTDNTETRDRHDRLHRFRSNIQHLFSLTGDPLPGISCGLDLPLRWLRHLRYVGLPKPPHKNSQTEKRLTTLCECFGVSLTDLWSKDLTVSVLSLPASVDDLLEKTIHKLIIAYEQLGRSREIRRVYKTLRLFHSPRAESCDQFKLNIQGLLKERELTPKSAADEIGVPYFWMRHLCYRGLTEQTRSSRSGQQDDEDIDRIGLICFYFGITDKHELWSNALISPIQSEFRHIQSDSFDNFMNGPDYQGIVQQVAERAEYPQESIRKMNIQTKAMLGGGQPESAILDLFRSSLELQ